MPISALLKPRPLWYVLVLHGLLCATVAEGITIEVRQYCEISGGCGAGDFFFDHPQALTALDFAVKAYEPFADSLTAIPASPNWTASFTNPETGFTGATVSNLSVPANTLILYAGGYDMPGGQVGQAGPGTANISLSRGQGTITGGAAVDFATWGAQLRSTLSITVCHATGTSAFSRLPDRGRLIFLRLPFTS